MISATSTDEALTFLRPDENQRLSSRPSAPEAPAPQVTSVLSNLSSTEGTPRYVWDEGIALEPEFARFLEIAAPRRLAVLARTDWNELSSSIAADLVKIVISRRVIGEPTVVSEEEEPLWIFRGEMASEETDPLRLSDWLVECRVGLASQVSQVHRRVLKTTGALWGRTNDDWAWPLLQQPTGEASERWGHRQRITPQEFLDQLYSLSEEGDREAAVDLALEIVDNLLCHDELAAVEEVLSLVDLQRLDTSSMVALLTITRGWRDQLRERPGFLRGVEKELRRVKPRWRVRAMLKGLR